MTDGIPRIEARALGWAWPDGSVAFDAVDLQLDAGTLTVLGGPSGTGKSTLLRLLAGLLPTGWDGRRGEVRLADGADPAALAPRDRVRRIGFVGQSPADQLLAGEVADELAFGPASACLPPTALRERVDDAARQLGFPAARGTRALSGGQQQRLVTAAATLAGADVVLLDEPLAWLDPQAARALVADLRRLADDGAAVLVVEHRLAPFQGFADRGWWLADGRLGPLPDTDLSASGGLGARPPGRGELAPREPAARSDGPGLDARAPRVPQAAPAEAAHDATTRPEPRTDAVGPGLDAPAPPGLSGPTSRSDQPATPPSIDDASLTTGRLRVTRGAFELDVPDLHLQTGERVALLGANGAGKSTLLAAIADALPGRAVRLPQDPDLALVAGTVDGELRAGAPQLDDAARDALLAAFDLPAPERSPHSLSRGQRLRLAVAAALATRPALLLLDEPTAGQDPAHVAQMLAALDTRGCAVLMSTHDHDLAARWADRVLRLHEGRLVDALPTQVAPSPLPASPADDPGWEPRTRLIALFLLSVVVILADRGATLALCAAASALAFLRTPGLPHGRTLIAMAVVAWSTALGQGLFRAPTPPELFAIGPVHVYQDGFVHGLIQSLRVIAVTTAGLSVAGSSSPDALLRALRGLGAPWPLAFLTGTALRLAPQLAEEWVAVRDAARARGIRPRGLGRLRSELSALRPVMARSVRRAANLGEALRARGFDAAAARTDLPRPAWPASEKRLVAAAGAVVAAATVARLLWLLYVTGTWYDPRLRPVYALVRGWL